MTYTNLLSLHYMILSDTHYNLYLSSCLTYNILPHSQYMFRYCSDTVLPDTFSIHMRRCSGYIVQNSSHMYYLFLILLHSSPPCLLYNCLLRPLNMFRPDMPYNCFSYFCHWYMFLPDSSNKSFHLNTDLPNIRYNTLLLLLRYLFRSGICIY